MNVFGWKRMRTPCVFFFFSFQSHLRFGLFAVCHIYTYISTDHLIFNWFISAVEWLFKRSEKRSTHDAFLGVVKVYLKWIIMITSMEFNAAVGPICFECQTNYSNRNGQFFLLRVNFMFLKIIIAIKHLTWVFYWNVYLIHMWCWSSSVHPFVCLIYIQIYLPWLLNISTELQNYHPSSILFK